MGPLVAQPAPPGVSRCRAHTLSAVGRPQRTCLTQSGAARQPLRFRQFSQWPPPPLTLQASEHGPGPGGPLPATSPRLAGRPYRPRLAAPLRRRCRLAGSNYSPTTCALLSGWPRLPAKVMQMRPASAGSGRTCNHWGRPPERSSRSRPSPRRPQLRPPPRDRMLWNVRAGARRPFVAELHKAAATCPKVAARTVSGPPRPTSRLG